MPSKRPVPRLKTLDDNEMTEAQRKLRQMYRDCEILECICHRGTVRTPVSSYERVIDLITRCTTQVFVEWSGQEARFDQFVSQSQVVPGTFALFVVSKHIQIQGWRLGDGNILRNYRLANILFAKLVP